MDTTTATSPVDQDFDCPVEMIRALRATIHDTNQQILSLNAKLASHNDAVFAMHPRQSHLVTAAKDLQDKICNGEDLVDDWLSAVDELLAHTAQLRSQEIEVESILKLIASLDQQLDAHKAKLHCKLTEYAQELSFKHFANLD